MTDTDEIAEGFHFIDTFMKEFLLDHVELKLNSIIHL